MAHTARLDRATAATLVAALLMPAAVALIFFYVPSDVDQGYSQRIFYFHVPIALTTYTLFAWGAVNAARYLWTGSEELDLQSYVPMHLGVIFGSLTLITGSIWAHISWGTWWDWGSRELNTFLIIFLFYCAYFMLRFSVEPGERRARYSAVYALLGVGLIPLSVLAVRIAQDALHPIVFRSNGVNMDGQHVPHLPRRAGRDAEPRRLDVPRRDARQAGRRADGPAAPAGAGGRMIDESAVRSVAAVYGIAWVATLAYVVILNAKLGRLERQLEEIAGMLESRGSDA